jgi:DNA excision repair protein ERCC-4
LIDILIDSREQRPYSFGGLAVTTRRATLPTGDYALAGHEDQAAVERKSLADLVGCLMGSNRDRFERELARAGHYSLFAVVVEATLQDVTRGRYRSAMKPEAVLQSILTFMVRYGTSFIWAGNRAGGEYVTHGLLVKYLREVDLRKGRAELCHRLCSCEEGAPIGIV